MHTDDREDSIELLRDKAVESYGDTRQEAIETLASFGPEAIPALAEVAEEVTAHDDLAMEKIRELNDEADSS